MCDELPAAYDRPHCRWHRGHKSIAKKMTVKAMKARRKLLGQENEETLRSMSQIELVYNMKDRLKKAEELKMQVMKTFQRVFDQEDSDTLTSMSNLTTTDGNTWAYSYKIILCYNIVEFFCISCCFISPTAIVEALCAHASLRTCILSLIFTQPIHAPVRRDGNESAAPLLSLLCLFSLLIG